MKTRTTHIRAVTSKAKTNDIVQMDGKRLQKYWGKEVDALVEIYQQFERLIPNEKTTGSAHRGEDGRYVEELVRQYLKKYLPSTIEVLTGFILRPAVKTGLNGKERKNETDTHSTQLDIIIYNSGNYPIFQRFGDSVIVSTRRCSWNHLCKKTLKRQGHKK